MLTIKIVNDGTGTNTDANYRYQVLVNDTVIESGEVKGHDRRKGWQNLVEMLAIHSNYEKAKSEIEQIKRDWCGE
jgi:hypothetical protein